MLAPRLALLVLAAACMAATCMVAGRAASASAGAPAISKRSSVDEDLQDFWQAFKLALTDEDKSAVARLTHFPFVVRWGNDDPNDPSFEYKRDQFLGVLGRLLRLGENGELPNHWGGGDYGDTMRDLIESTTSLQEEDSSGSASLGCFEFRRVGKHWRWTTAFSGDNQLLGIPESWAIPPSPLRKYLLDVLSQALALKRPLLVRHLRRTGTIAYVEAKESGPNGRLARAVLRWKGTDAEGHAVWIVDRSSVGPVDANRGAGPEKLATPVGADVPASLFLSQGRVNEEGVDVSRISLPRKEPRSH
jgi:hypothetical protein